ncbi:MAG: hypothetical protein KIT22_10460 [Verrucomicrobiae bacterium]|nr:hypothetical protein [Verrucomicrobiae bacterium]
MTTLQRLLTCWVAAGLLTAVSTAAPAGDSMDEPILASGVSWSMTVDTRRATAEPGEPPPGPANPPVSPQHSLWFAWVAPESGRVMWIVRSLEDSALISPYAGKLFVAAYTKAPAGGLGLLLRQQAVDWHDAGLSFVVTAGTEYRFCLDSHDLAAGGFDVALAYTDAAIPANDSPSQAVDLAQSSGWAVFDLYGATPGPEDSYFGFSARVFFGNRYDEVEELPRGGNSVWYSWTAPKAGEFVLTASMPGSFPQLAVYRDSNPAEPGFDFSRFQLAAHETNGWVVLGYRYRDPSEWHMEPQEDGFIGTHSRRVVLQAQAGDRFLIQVDQMIPVEWSDYKPQSYPWGLNPIEQSVGLIRINQRLPNDDLAASVALVPDQPVLAWGAASLEDSESALAGAGAAGSWWWHWTADREETIGVQPQQVRVFTGEQWADLQPVPTIPSHASVNPGFTTFKALPGVRYRIRVEAADSFGEEVLLRRGSTANRIADAVELGLHDGRMEAVIPLGLLTAEPDEPSDSRPGVSGVGWAIWTPGAPGRYRLRSDQRPLVFSGTNATWKQPVPISWNGTDLWVDATPAEHYWFAFSTLWANLDSVARILLLPLESNDAFDSPALATLGTFLNVTNSAGTTEAGEPHHAGRPPLASLWYLWNCPRSGRYSLVAEGPGNPRVALYRGGRLMELESLISLSPNPGAPAGRAWNALAGEEFRIAVEPGALDAPGVRWAIVENGPEEIVETAPSLENRWLTLRGGVPAREAMDDVLGTPDGYGTAWFVRLAAESVVPTVIWVQADLRAGWSQGLSPVLRLFRRSGSGELVPLGFSAPLAEPGRIVALCPAIAGTQILIQLCVPGDQPLLGSLLAGQAWVPAPPSPDSLSLSALGDRLRLWGPTGVAVRLERSRDLTQWQSEGNAECRSPFLDLQRNPDDQSPAYFRVVAY